MIEKVGKGSSESECFKKWVKARLERDFSPSHQYFFILQQQTFILDNYNQKRLLSYLIVRHARSSCNRFKKKETV